MEALDPSLDQIKALNVSVKETMANYKKDPPSRDEAFRRALKLEHTSGEYYYDRARYMRPESWPLKLFQDLSDQELSHAERILKLMRKHGILIHTLAQDQKVAT